MEIFVDGSAVSKMKGKTPISTRHGWAVVTEDTVYAGKSPCEHEDGRSSAVAVAEAVALLKAVVMAKAGDVIFTDQEPMVQALEAFGAVSGFNNEKAHERRMSTSHGRKLFSIKQTIDALLRTRQGVTIAHLPREHSTLLVSRKKDTTGAYLADQISRHAATAKHKKDLRKNIKKNENLFHALLGKKVIASSLLNG